MAMKNSYSTCGPQIHGSPTKKVFPAVVHCLVFSLRIVVMEIWCDVDGA